MLEAELTLKWLDTHGELECSLRQHIHMESLNLFLILCEESVAAVNPMLHCSF